MSSDGTSDGTSDGPAATKGPGQQSPAYGFELPLLLFAGFRSIIDELHAELARRGHPDLRRRTGSRCRRSVPAGPRPPRPAAGWGISKQAAGKTIDRLEELGYVHRAGDDADRRRKLIRLTPRGIAALAMSAMIFGDIRSRWESALGPGRLPRLNRTCGRWLPVRRSGSTYPAGSATRRRAYARPIASRRLAYALL